MLDYIRLDWEPKLLILTNVDRPCITASSSQLRQPIYKISIAKWKCYQSHLKRLLRATNAKIVWLPINILRLPAVGMLNNAVEYDKERLLHLSEHAAANFMLELVYAQKTSTMPSFKL
jgi:hypothetical protein